MCVCVCVAGAEQMYCYPCTAEQYMHWEVLPTEFNLEEQMSSLVP